MLKSSVMNDSEANPESVNDQSFLTSFDRHLDRHSTDVNRQEHRKVKGQIRNILAGVRKYGQLKHLE